MQKPTMHREMCKSRKAAEVAAASYGFKPVNGQWVRDFFGETQAAVFTEEKDKCLLEIPN